MKTRLLMFSSALFMAVLGVAASFLPQEILALAGAQDEGAVVLVVQIAGALYMGFAFLNWTARELIIGGIYGRPVLLGNILHFVVVTLTLWKAVIAGPSGPGIVVGVVVYSLFATSFGLLLFVHPGASKKFPIEEPEQARPLKP